MRSGFSFFAIPLSRCLLRPSAKRLCPPIFLCCLPRNGFLTDHLTARNDYTSLLRLKATAASYPSLLLSHFSPYTPLPFSLNRLLFPPPLRPPYFWRQFFAQISLSLPWGGSKSVATISLTRFFLYFILPLSENHLFLVRRD